MATPHGIGFRWGIDAASTAFGSSYSVQSYTVDSKGTKKLLNDSVGNYAGYVGYQLYRELNTSIIVTNASATTSASVVIPQLYSMITITSAQDGSITGSNWIVENVKVSAQYDDFTKFDITACSYSQITT